MLPVSLERLARMRMRGQSHASGPAGLELDEARPKIVHRNPSLLRQFPTRPGPRTRTEEGATQPHCAVPPRNSSIILVFVLVRVGRLDQLRSGDGAGVIGNGWRHGLRHPPSLKREHPRSASQHCNAPPAQEEIDGIALSCLRCANSSMVWSFLTDASASFYFAPGIGKRWHIVRTSSRRSL